MSTQKILNEVLNNDLEALDERLHADPHTVDSIGHCGESALHIAIYKHNMAMIKLLINFGADPNVRNTQRGDTAVMTAARMGLFAALELMYETGRCDLFLRNADDRTALDIALDVPRDHELQLTRLYGYWDGRSDLESVRVPMERGRKDCASYLKDKMDYDAWHRRRILVEEATAAHERHLISRRILRGDGFGHQAVFFEELTEPEVSGGSEQDQSPTLWDKTTVEFFESHPEDVTEVATRLKAIDFVGRSCATAKGNAAHSLLST
jgi:Ankyrin repeats (many copies)